MIAIKNWFLFKNDLNWMRRFTLEVRKETEKAVLVGITDRTVSMYTESHWVPKSCLIDEWEKDTSGFAYHRYLEDKIHEAYDLGIIENKTIVSGRNTYRGDAFVHQQTTKELIWLLNKYEIEFMERKEWEKN